MSSAQTIEWTNVYSNQSRGFSLIETHSGDYLACGYDTKTEKGIASLHQPNGDLIWKKDISDSPRDFMHGIELEDGSLLFLTGKGDLYLTNNVGESLSFLFNLYPSGSVQGNIKKVSKKGNQILVSGSWSKDGKLGRLHILFNLSNFTVESQIFVEGALTVSGAAFHTDNTIIECIYKYKFNASKFLFRKLMLDGTPVWEKELDAEGKLIQDLVIGSNDQIYLTGRVKDDVDQDRYHGLLMAFDQDGEGLWERQYSTIIETNIIRQFSRIDAHDGFLVMGGEERWIFGFSKLSLLKCDLNGDPIWNVNESVIGRGHETGDLIFDRNGKIIICGSTGIDDDEGPERLFVMGLSDLSVSTNEELASEAKWQIYPVPARDYLHIDFNTLAEDYSIEVFDLNGRLIGQWQNSSKIDVRPLAVGTYWLRMTTANQSSTKKWIKAE